MDLRGVHKLKLSTNKEKYYTQANDYQSVKFKSHIFVVLIWFNICLNDLKMFLFFIIMSTEEVSIFILQK